VRLLCTLATLLAAAALTVAAVGCGGGGSDTSTAPSTSASAPPPSQSSQPSEGNGSKPAKEAGKEREQPSSKAKPGGSESGERPQPSIAEEESESADQSIQEFGSEAEGTEAEAVVDTMRSYFRALANRNLQGVCSGLLAANREQLEEFAKAKPGGPEDCVGVLKNLLSPAAAAEAKKTFGATISKVRVGDGHAFVLFRPPGGRVSYFVLEEEDGSWKATSIAPGAPLVP
jgi:hypothetical protein